MAPGAFNHFRVKRQAHSIGRHDSGWNPFGHTFWRQKDGRRETWNGKGNRARDVEAARAGQDGGGDDGDDLTSPMRHVSTAPNPLRRGSDDASDMERTPITATAAQDFEARDGESVRLAGESSNGTGISKEAGLVTGSEAPDGVRKRSTAKPSGNGVMNAAAEEDEKPKEKKDRRFFKHITPKEPFTAGNQIRRTLLGSWINVLLLAAPAGIALGYVPNMNGIAMFVVNFIAIIPLAALLSFATEEIALRTGETLGGLLNATFGNAVELIVAILALVKGEVTIVQTSLIGSILSNLLLVMGMCFFFGGLGRQQQYFNTTVAQTAASLLALAVAGVIVPTVFDKNTEDARAGPDKIAALSRGTAIILLFVYFGYLYFQLKTHAAVFSEPSEKVPKQKPRESLREGAIAQGFVGPAGLMGAHGLSSQADNEALRERLTTPPGADRAGSDEEDEGEEPQLSFPVAVATLTASTVIVAFCAEFMVDGISTLTAKGVSEEFTGLILLPIVGNAAEHATAVTVAIKDKMDLAIGVAVGSSMQVALLLIPLMVIIGWCLGNDQMSLSFDVFQVAVMFVSVLLVNYLIADGKSHWLEGMLLMSLYLVIAVCSWYYPVG